MSGGCRGARCSSSSNVSSKRSCGAKDGGTDGRAPGEGRSKEGGGRQRRGKGQGARRQRAGGGLGARDKECKGSCAGARAKGGAGARALTDSACSVDLPGTSYPPSYIHMHVKRPCSHAIPAWHLSPTISASRHAACMRSTASGETLWASTCKQEEAAGSNGGADSAWVVCMQQMRQGT